MMITFLEPLAPAVASTAGSSVQAGAEGVSAWAKARPQRLIAEGTDWRIFRELTKELKA